jgi:hypothetical protein
MEKADIKYEGKNTATGGSDGSHDSHPLVLGDDDEFEDFTLQFPSSELDCALCLKLLCDPVTTTLCGVCILFVSACMFLQG